MKEVSVRKVIVSEFVTLDGVMEDPGGSEEFEHGGWAFQFDRGPEGDKFKLDEALASDALLLGRTTYEGFAEAWPSRDGEFADKFNNMPKYVVSKTLEEPLEWNNSTLIKDNVAEEVSRLKQQPGGDILVNGSAQLVHTLIPIVVGTGKRLFGDVGRTRALRLVDTQPVGSDGVLILAYEPAGQQADG
jgi:dihydrofolate reductase